MEQINYHLATIAQLVDILQRPPEPIEPSKTLKDPLDRHNYDRHLLLWNEVDRLLQQNHKLGPLSYELYEVLFCKAHLGPNSLMIGLPPHLDQAWHYAILNTTLYQAMCQDLFGFMLPHSTVSEQDAQEQKDDRIFFTSLVYKALFDKNLIQAKENRRSKRRKKDPKTGPAFIMVYMKDLEGKTLTFQARPSMPIVLLRELYSLRSGTPGDLVRMVFSGSTLHDDQTVETAGLVDESTIHLVMRVRGC